MSRSEHLSTRAAMVAFLATGDGFLTSEFAEVFNIPVSKARQRLEAVSGLVGTAVNADSDGRARDAGSRNSGRYASLVWQVYNPEDPVKVAEVVDAIFGNEDPQAVRARAFAAAEAAFERVRVTAHAEHAQALAALDGVRDRKMEAAHVAYFLAVRAADRAFTEATTAAGDAAGPQAGAVGGAS
jgi:hypothetical protein